MITDKDFENMTYEQVVQLTLKELKGVEKIKKKRIIILAKKLESLGTPKEMISQRISRDLQGLVNSSYVRLCLGDAYKDKTQIRKQSSSQSRQTTRANEGKKVLLAVTSEGKQDTGSILSSKQIESISQGDDTPERYQEELREVKQERDYLATKLAEKSPEFQDLYEEIKLKEIESSRIKSEDFKSADSLPANDKLQTEILERRIVEQDKLLAKTRFEAELELREQVIPLIVVIDRVTDRATVTVDTSKMKKWID